MPIAVGHFLTPHPLLADQYFIQFVCFDYLVVWHYFYYGVFELRIKDKLPLV